MNYLGTEGPQFLQNSPALVRQYYGSASFGSRWVDVGSNGCVICHLIVYSKTHYESNNDR